MSLLRSLFRRSQRQPADDESAGALSTDIVIGEEEAPTSQAPEPDLAGQLDALLQQIAKLGREQLQTNSLLDAQAESFDELSAAWREHLSQREQDGAEARRALAELEGQLRLSLAKDLLPTADALAEGIRSARELAEQASAGWGRGSISGSGDRKSGARGLWPWRRHAAPSPAPPLAAFGAWLEGLLLVERRLLALLEREGIRPIAAVGQPFDPKRHLAVAVDSGGTDAPEDTVVGEVLRGYVVGDRVLRYAEVVVARPAASNQNAVSRAGIAEPKAED